MEKAAAADSATKGFGRFMAEYLPLFSVNMLGLVAVRIWIQCNLYDRYASTDSGVVTIATNLFRVLVIAVLIALVVRRGFSPAAQRRLAWGSTVAMTLASALFLIDAEAPAPGLVEAACLLAGFGIAWGGGMWITLYVRLAAGEALLYAFLSLGASSVAGFFLGLAPAYLTYLVAMLMPALSLIACQRAHRLVDERERLAGARPEGAGEERAYDREPRSTFVRLVAGIALFNLALGIARGFPSGQSIELPLAFQAIHQLAAAALSFGLIWWALVARRTVKFSTLWNVSVTLIAAGVLVLATLDAGLTPAGATLIAVANTFSVGLLWFSAYDVARHSSVPSYIILGVTWAAHILPREVGRALIWIAEPHTTEAVFVTVGIVLLVAASMALLLSDSLPSTRPLFADFRTAGGASRWRERIAVEAGAAPAAAAEEEGPARDSLAERIGLLQARYLLTDREAEVVSHLAQGRSKTAIGEKLFISENTVRTYVKNIYAKLDVHSKQELLDLLDEQPAQTLGNR
ncbi:helix-turn-helix transcriptional regulator [Arabiibacter massiliensis]|uniref:helix-turn-helix transcriptional regulator n=1 Tax=Arabiibacter massiliensis TaxID=1870985 RepID=UPI00117B3DB9|nr:response regulator transcription factor [Arabiibacter massiliensis]